MSIVCTAIGVLIAAPVRRAKSATSWSIAELEAPACDRCGARSSSALSPRAVERRESREPPMSLLDADSFDGFALRDGFGAARNRRCTNEEHLIPAALADASVGVERHRPARKNRWPLSSICHDDRRRLIGRRRSGRRRIRCDRPRRRAISNPLRCGSYRPHGLDRSSCRSRKSSRSENPRT